MTYPRWYRGLPESLATVAWSLLGIALAVLAAWLWLRMHDERVRADERAKTSTVADSLRPIVWPVQYARLTRERDSLREVLVVRDSIAGASAAAARASIDRLRVLLATKPTTHYDTVLIAAATETANMCTTAANDCDSVRAANTRLQYVKDSVQRADSIANARLLLSMSSQTRTIGNLTERLQSRPTWITVTKGTTGGALLGFGGGFAVCALRR